MRSLLITVGMTAVVTVAAALASETKEFDASTIREVEIENISGNIRIVGTRDPVAKVTTEKVIFDDGCTLFVGQKGDTLKVDVDRKMFRRKARCEVNMSLEIPENAEVDVENDSGDLEIIGVRGKIEHDIERGQVRIQ